MTLLRNNMSTSKVASDKYLGTSYDVVKAVYDNLAAILNVSDANDLEALAQLVELAALTDLTELEALNTQLEAGVANAINLQALVDTALLSLNATNLVSGLVALARLPTGAGNGLDSDLLDGQHGAYYQNATNINAGTIASARLPSIPVGLLPNGAGNAIDADLLDGQHGAYYRDADNLNAGTVALARLPTGFKTGFDADLLDGQHGAYYRDAANLNAGLLPVARIPEMTVPFHLANGTVELPGMTFASDPATGYWSAGLSDMQSTVDGAPITRQTPLGFYVDDGASNWIHVYDAMLANAVTAALGVTKGDAAQGDATQALSDAADGISDAAAAQGDATQALADAATAASDSLPLAGGTLTGHVLGITPTIAAHLGRKDYIDAVGTAAAIATNLTSGNIPAARLSTNTDYVIRFADGSKSVPSIKIGAIDTGFYGTASAINCSVGDDLILEIRAASVRSSEGFIALTGDDLFYGYSSNTGYTDSLAEFHSNRSSSPLFDFIACAGDAVTKFRVNGVGTVYSEGTYETSGADYAECFEWSDGNPKNIDRVGLSVIVIDQEDSPYLGMIREAEGGETPFGIISANPTVLGDSASLSWQGTYKVDEFDRRIVDSKGNHTYSSDYLPPKAIGTDKEGKLKYEVTYIPRIERKEWDAVGTHGKLWIKPGQVVDPSWRLIGKKKNGLRRYYI